MDQRATSIRACRQVADLCVRLQIPSARFVYLLNKVTKNAPISDIDASMALDGVEILSVLDGGWAVDELLSLGCPLELLRTNIIANSVSNMLAKFCVSTTLSTAFAVSSVNTKISRLQKRRVRNNVQSKRRLLSFGNARSEAVNVSA
jgi:pilus assembly protein CpaE